MPIHLSPPRPYTWVRQTCEVLRTTDGKRLGVYVCVHVHKRVWGVFLVLSRGKMSSPLTGSLRVPEQGPVCRLSLSKTLRFVTDTEIHEVCWRRGFERCSVGPTQGIWVSDGGRVGRKTTCWNGPSPRPPPGRAQFSPASVRGPRSPGLEWRQETEIIGSRGRQSSSDKRPGTGSGPERSGEGW